MSADIANGPLRRLDLPSGSKGPPLTTVIRRIIWGTAWTFLFRPWPRRIGNGWRTSLLRMFGAKIGRNVLLSPTMRVMKPWELSIGDDSAIGDRVRIYNFCRVNIGSMCLVSQDCYLCTGTHNYLDPKMPLIVKVITIRSESWIAAGSFVHPGVTIGEGTVVGARSVVTKDMPAWTVCAGHPWRPIKPRQLIFNGE